MRLWRAAALGGFMIAGILPWNVAWAQAAAWSDEQLEAYASRDFLLEREITSAIFADDSIRAELMRVGLEQGCLRVARPKRSAVERHWPAFRPRLVAAVRAVVTRQGRVPPAIPMGLSGNGDVARVRRQLEPAATALFRTAGDEARAALIAELASMPSVAAAEAAGRFADWRFERPLATQIACSIIGSTHGRPPDHFQRSKRAFDGFFRRQGEN